MNTLEQFEQIKNIILSPAMEKDISSFCEKGNKAAGIRIRKELQTIKKLADAGRKEIQARKNNS